MRRAHPPSLGCLCAGLALAAAGCGGAESRTPPLDASCRFVTGSPGPNGSAAVRAETLVDGLEVPWGLALLPEGAGLLVTERPGRIRRVDATFKLQEEPVATVPIAPGGEGGLLGIALHPGFAENRIFFVYATVEGDDGDPENRVLRYRLAADGASATPDGVLVSGIPAAPFHDGGRLRIGPDGLLWIGTGDARDPERARDPLDPAGKILRVSPDDGSVPEGNPWPGSRAWVLGVRNVQAFDWFADGTLAVADHGPSGEFGLRGRDEVSVAERGVDLGWPEITGCEARSGMVAPRIAWEEAVPPGGAAFYRGGAIPEWRGALLVATLGSRHLHVLHFGPERRIDRHAVYFRGDPPDGLGRLRDVVVTPSGEILVTTSNCDGRGTCPPGGDRIVRIVPAR